MNTTALEPELTPEQYSGLVGRVSDTDPCRTYPIHSATPSSVVSDDGPRSISDRIDSTHRSPISTYLTVEQVANILAVSTDTVLRQFGDMSGVLDLGTPETRFKRRKRILRIPRSTLERYIASREVRRSR